MFSKKQWPEIINNSDVSHEVIGLFFSFCIHIVAQAPFRNTPINFDKKVCNSYFPTSSVKVSNWVKREHLVNASFKGKACVGFHPY